MNRRLLAAWLLPLGPRLVEACGIGPGMKVLDVAAGTGNASIPAVLADNARVLESILGGERDIEHALVFLWR